MQFKNRRLCRHKTIYRTLNLPHSVANELINVDCVDLEYDEKTGIIIVRPVRNPSAKTHTTVKAKIEAIEDHNLAAHFKL